MKTVTFTVREISQSASGASYVVGYTADVELTEFPSVIEIGILSTKPADATAEFIDYAIQHTKEGFAEVLEPLGYGAKARISNLLLHYVDYKSYQQRAFSAKYLAIAINSLTTDN